MQSLSQNPLEAANPAHSAVVKASAGVGKTYLLVTRLIRLLLAGVKPDAILAITFTRKAAAEMQSRLAERLFEFVVCNDGELKQKLESIDVPATPENLATARQLYERLMKHENPVRATTFHAFCQDVLRRFPLEADVPPAFDLVENTASLSSDAWDALYAEATLEPDGELGQALESLFDLCGGLANTQDSLQNFLEHRGDWWAFTQQGSDPLEFAIDTLLEQLRIDPDEEPLGQFLNRLEVKALDDFTTFASKHPINDHVKAIENINAALNIELEPQQRYRHLYDAFFTGGGTPRKRKSSAAMEKKMGAANASQFIEIHQHFVTLLEQFSEHLNKFKTYHLCRVWYVVGQRLLDYFQRLKLEQRQLDFGDLEWKTYALLHHSNNASWVQYKLDQRIEHFLVDEFQDTNPTQWQLLLPLLEELAVQADDRSVFIVGDDKQSIYAFRRAEPKLLDESANWIEQHLGAARYPMDKSRRSASAIMETVNRTFTSDNDSTFLNDFHPHSTFNEDLWGMFKLLPLIEPDEDIAEAEKTQFRNPLLEPRIIKQDTRHYREAQMIALTINNMVKNESLIGAYTAAHKACFSDFMILLRTRSHAQDYEKALREADIPYLSATNENLLEALEIQDLISLLQILQAPLNNLAFATVLRSPLFACSDDELLSVASFEQGDTWYEKLLAMRETNQINEHFNQILRQIETWRHYASFLPIHDLLDKIYFEKRVIERYKYANPAHLQNQVVNNLHTFINLALEVNSGRYPSIGRFLASLEELKENGEAIYSESPENQNCVRIMTIHGSKGLEAPVVFIADAASGNNESKPYRTLIHWPASEQKPTNFLLLGKKEDQDPLSKRLLEIEKRRFEQEDMNLLYVALTRARQLLFVSGCRPNRGNTIPGWYGFLQRQLGEGAVIESGNRPIDSVPTINDEPTDIQLDSRLAIPFEQSAPTQEISPSQLLEDSEYQDEHGRHRGIAIHRILELLSDNKEMNKAQILSQVGAELGLPASDALLNECFSEASNTIENPLFAPYFDHKHFKQAYNELPLQFKQGTRWVNGIIDRLVMAEDRITIIDYKTHRISEQEIAHKAREYEQQLSLYKTGINQMWPGQQVCAILLFTGPAKVFELG